MLVENYNQLGPLSGKSLVLFCNSVVKCTLNFPDYCCL